jgi:hypothetical protein
MSPKFDHPHELGGTLPVRPIVCVFAATRLLGGTAGAEFKSSTAVRRVVPGLTTDAGHASQVGDGASPS